MVFPAQELRLPAARRCTRCRFGCLRLHSVTFRRRYRRTYRRVSAYAAPCKYSDYIIKASSGIKAPIGARKCESSRAAWPPRTAAALASAGAPVEFWRLPRCRLWFLITTGVRVRTLGSFLRHESEYFLFCPRRTPLTY